MIVSMYVDLIYAYQDINLIGKNNYKDKRYSTENNCMMNMCILYDYSSLDYIKITINIYIASIIKNKPIIFNKNMIEIILDGIRSLYEQFSYGKNIYDTNPKISILMSREYVNEGYIIFMDDRMNSIDRINIENCCVYDTLSFLYSCYLYESTIKWI